MNTEIINVGNELLSGRTLNRNVQILSKALSLLGIKTDFNTAVGDNEKDIIDVSNIALERSDLIIYSGGLGPTRDDFTKEIVSKVLNKPLKLDQDILEEMREFFKSRNINMTDNNIKQAYIPEDSIVLKNENGTAPGIFLDYNGKYIVLLPGPPRELEPMFKNQVIPLISQLAQNTIISRNIKTIGLGESELETIIEDIIGKYDFVDIATYARVGQVDVFIKVSLKDKKEAQRVLEKVFNKVKDRLEDYIYSYNNKTIEEVVFDLLKLTDKKVGFCESCTGGLISSRITKLAGASEVLDRSIVTYSNNSKMEEVSVKKETLDRYGAVSEQTAVEMARGLQSREDVDIAVSVTGIAGPGGDSDDKPLGLVYIALVAKDVEIVEEHIFRGSRNYVQERTCMEAFNLIRKHILTDLEK